MASIRKAGKPTVRWCCWEALFLSHPGSPFFFHPARLSFLVLFTCTHSRLPEGWSSHTDCLSDSSGFFLQRKLRNRDMKAGILLSPTWHVRTGTPQAIYNKAEAPKPAMRTQWFHFLLSLTCSHTPLSHPASSLAWIPSGTAMMHALSTCPSFT